MSSKTTSAHRRRGARRYVAVAGPVVAGALLLAACGSSSDDGATQSTIDLSQGSTAFVVRPPVTTLPTETTTPEGGVSGVAQEYTIQSGDYPLKVANQFGITVDELVAFNEWGSVNEFPYPGTVIQIPPGATVAGATTTTVAGATPTGSTAEAAETTAPAGTIPDTGDNCGEGEYTIVDGDYEGKVASNFDVTVEALRAANASTQGYSAFYPGLTIVIPGKSDC